MDTVVLVLMLLIAFNFLLKQTFWKTVAVGIIATVAALFAGLMYCMPSSNRKHRLPTGWVTQP